MPLTRCCIVKNDTGNVVNVIDYESIPVSGVPGYGNEYSAIPSLSAQIGWHWNGADFDNPNPPPVVPAPDPGTVTPRMVAAAFNVEIGNGDVQRIDGAFNLIAALYLGIGQVMLLFLNPEPDNEYVAQVLDGALSIRVTEKATDYLIVEGRDTGGALADPASFGLSVYRF